MFMMSCDVMARSNVSHIVTMSHNVTPTTILLAHICKYLGFSLSSSDFIQSPDIASAPNPARHNNKKVKIVASLANVGNEIY